MAALPGPGGEFLALWSVKGGLEYFRVSPEGRVKAHGRLPLEVDTPTRSPTGLLASPGALFWRGGAALTDLWSAPLDPDVPSLGTPVLLTAGVRAITLVPSSLLATRTDGLWWIPMDSYGRPVGFYPLAEHELVRSLRCSHDGQCSRWAGPFPPRPCW